MNIHRTIEIGLLFRIPSLAEREGFEPSVRLRVRSISNAVHSTALSPLPNAFNMRKMKGIFKFKTRERRLLSGLNAL